MGGNEAKVQPGQSYRRSGGLSARTASVRFRPAISPTLFEDDQLPFRDCPSRDSVFSFNHALLTENKDSVNGTGLGFMVWGEALKALWSDTQSI